MISAGASHTCAISMENDIYCWGSNDHGELGNGGIQRPGLPGNSTPGLVGGGAKYRMVSAGASHTCGIATNRNLYCWGRGVFGQLGNGGTADWAMPQWVGGGYTTVSAGLGTHTCATRTDEMSYCWGTGKLGQLGAYGTSFTAVPIRVGIRR